MCIRDSYKPLLCEAMIDNGEIAIGWDPKPLANGSSDDYAIVLLYNKTKDEVIVDVNGETRSRGYTGVDFHDHWLGDELEVYIGFVSDDGKLISDSMYMGLSLIHIFSSVLLASLCGVHRLKRIENFTFDALVSRLLKLPKNIDEDTIRRHLTGLGERGARSLHELLLDVYKRQVLSPAGYPISQAFYEFHYSPYHYRQ